MLGLNAGITGLLPSYGVNSQALMQDGMKSQAIWEHTVISHVIRFTDMNSWLLSSGLISSSPMSLTGGKCWLQSITKQHQSGDPSAASPSPCLLFASHLRTVALGQERRYAGLPVSGAG